MKVWERVVTTAPERPRLSTHHKGRGSVPGVLRAARLPRVGSTVVSDCVWFCRAGPFVFEKEQGTEKSLTPRQ